MCIEPRVLSLLAVSTGRLEGSQLQERRQALQRDWGVGSQGLPRACSRQRQVQNPVIHLWTSWPHPTSSQNLQKGLLACLLVCLGVQPPAQAANQPTAGCFQIL